MKYKLIFTLGYSYDSEALLKGYRSDVLLLDEKGSFYEINFVEPQVISNAFDGTIFCYLETNLVVLSSVSRENIIKVVSELHRWKFFLRWHPLPIETVEKFFFPMDKWDILDVIVF